MSYRLRLVITIALLFALSFGASGAILITVSFHSSLEEETQAALSLYEDLSKTIVLLNDLDALMDIPTLSFTMEQIGSSWQAVSLKTPEGVLYQKQPVLLTGSRLSSGDVGKCQYVRIADRMGHALVIVSNIGYQEKSLELMVRYDLSGVFQARDLQLRIYRVVYLCVMLFGVICAVVLSYVLTRRLTRLTVAVRRISGGDLAVRSRLTSKDEFGQLSRDFDAMADKLQTNISHLETDIQNQEQFMGAFAHELKTPMTSIIGFADLIRQGGLDENTGMMAAEYIYSESRRLERISFKLLGLLLLKRDSIVMQRLWLANYLAEVERALAPNVRSKGIQLVCRAEQVRVALEPDLVKSLLYNLVDNAAKAMDSGGIIAVKGTAIPGGCQFQVADNGRGMEPSELSRITDAFYRVDKARSRSQGGAGLGLALCKQIVELHKGSIHFDSAPGKGTRVTVTLYGKAGGKKHGKA